MRLECDLNQKLEVSSRSLSEISLELEKLQNKFVEKYSQNISKKFIMDGFWDHF